jgi:hypothetical protein
MLDPQDPQTSILELAEHGRDGFWASIVDDDDFHRDVKLIQEAVDCLDKPFWTWSERG